MLKKKHSEIFRAHPPALAWSLLELQGSTSSGTWKAPGLGACQAVFHTFFLTPLCLCSVLLFLKNVFQEVPPVWLKGSVLANGGSLLKLTGTGCAWHGAALASPYIGCPAAPVPQHLGTGIQYSLCLSTPQLFSSYSPSHASSLNSWDNGGNVYHHDIILVPHSIAGFCYKLRKFLYAAPITICISSFIEEELVISGRWL